MVQILNGRYRRTAVTIPTKNKARCRNCKDVIESRFRHEFVSCTCYREGQALLNAYDDKHYKLESEKFTSAAGKVYELPRYDYDPMYADPVRNAIIKNWRGFCLDGGSDYFKVLGTFTDMERLYE
jgi:hypothetical protein